MIIYGRTGVNDLCLLEPRGSSVRKDLNNRMTDKETPQNQNFESKFERHLCSLI
jgi:hypothetical protein